MNNMTYTAVLTALLTASAGADEYLGNLTRNPYDEHPISNPYGAGGPFGKDSPHNPFGDGLRIEWR